ncbi:MAG: hypothetical protein KDB27_25270 [Planctomycetales bacterium]|nr:hypothetical protein [Planctomycetales bacterium]
MSSRVLNSKRRKTVVRPNRGRRDERCESALAIASILEYTVLEHTVLEYIARHDLGNSAKGGFHPPDDILFYASEIGLVADDVLATGKIITSKLELSYYERQSLFFTAMGELHALPLLVERNREIECSCQSASSQQFHTSYPQPFAKWHVANTRLRTIG